ncbi:MAG: glycerol-3-phosphate 1-O-acyltransferase PlsY [Armatimonadota bacterium]|nr:glycerol-3-phosphate 1-O-acyltransferase PlsY [Armatimonadota bacterium]MDW8104194.1 glycerol-3-phosphate 1-O-acyltransferase PlsY [Armatimonadota bacterium]MDW8290734.1 glycerol-3-phosphate 1-O-acyltransferase PlsY [Armatimonadota bacterium]
MSMTDLLLWLGRDYGLALLVGYLIGGIPFGWLVAKLWKGVDLREVGSGNIGATNAYRVLGPVAGVLVFLLDTAKGSVPIVLGRLFYWDGLSAGIGAIVGHSFSPYLRGKGGRAVATSLGVFLALSPWASLCAFATWGVVLLLTRYVSVASVIGSLSLSLVWMWIFPTDDIVQVAALFAALWITWKHRPNFQRLRAGTEPRVTVGRRH